MITPDDLDALEARFLRSQRIHAMEHETGQPLTLPCEVVQHLPRIDQYQSFLRHQADEYERLFMPEWARA